jgi:hypothetical protein
MTWLLVLSGFKGFIIPNIILGAFIYCMLRPEFVQLFAVSVLCCVWLYVLW